MNCFEKQATLTCGAGAGSRLWRRKKLGLRQTPYPGFALTMPRHQAIQCLAERVFLVCLGKRFGKGLHTAQGLIVGSTRAALQRGIDVGLCRIGFGQKFFKKCRARPLAVRKCGGLGTLFTLQPSVSGLIALCVDLRHISPCRQSCCNRRTFSQPCQ